MISIKNISVISRYETRILWRNWFFKIFGILAILFLLIFNLAAFSSFSNGQWFFYANSWNMPYANMLMLSIGQVAAVIFLATGSITKNKKIDTNEVFYVRAISNADYVFGKAIAVFKLFFWLNLVLLVPVMIINLTNPAADFNILAYMVYPLLVSFPSIIFTTGIAFFLATILRNQPVTIILLLGLSAVIIIYFLGRYENILDFMAFRLDMMASEISGFSNFEFILYQRGFYVVSGIAFLFGTALFLDRLSSHQNNRYKLGIVILLFIGAASFLMVSLWNTRNDSITKRAEMVEINGLWADAPNIEILSNHIQLTHLGNEIEAVSKISAVNHHSMPLDTIYFTLNPDLKVSKLLMNDQKESFNQKLQVITIPLKDEISSGKEITVEIAYKGEITEDVAHLEVGLDRYQQKDQSFIYPVGKRYAFLQPDYVLLTNDVLWYPDTQIGYSTKSPVKDRTSFIDFKLDVKVLNNHTAVSQGSVTETEEGVFQFRPEFALPQISLTIGTYQKKALTVDSISYELYYYEGDDYFSSYFDEMGDTLNYLMTDLKNGYESEQKLKYPFKRLQFVESPIQFSAYDKIYEGHQSFVQPELILLPEKGGDNRSFDLKRQFSQMDQQAKRENKVMSDKEKQANVFNDLVKKEFTSQIVNNFFFDGRDADDPSYAIFPNLYDYHSGIASNDWPTLNRSIASYLNNEKQPGNDFSRNINGISFAEECNELMLRNTLMEILTQDLEFAKIKKSISLKGEYLFSFLEQLLGKSRFKEFMYQWINRNQHIRSSYKDFREEVKVAFNLDIDPIIKQIYSDTDQPSFEIDNLQKYEILDGDRKRYQLLVDVKNTGTNDGVVKVNFNSVNESNNRFGFSGRTNQVADINFPEYLSVIKKGEIIQLGFLLDAKPNQISVNTLVSQNIPSVITFSVGQFTVRENFTPFEGERKITEEKIISQYEIIVDDEDPGFSTFSPIKDTYLKEYMDSRNPSDKKYFGIWRRSYSKWQATTGSDFYGQHIRSAHFTRSGKGEKTVEWKPQLNEEGFYDLYIFMIGKNQGQSNNRGNTNRNYTYQYFVNHLDGQDEISFNLANAERGWNYLGSYYFPKEGASVVLTDLCEQRTVYADAIKWVKQ